MNRSSSTIGSRDRDFLTGQLLIAMPNMGDPRFERSVIFICSHDEEHAMGVIVNKQIDDVAFADLLEQLEIEPGDHAPDTPVFFGGPVQTQRGLVIHTLDYHAERTIDLGGIGLTATRDIIADIGGRTPQRPAPSRYLLAIGHAGWGAGQLEEEIVANAWAHCDRDESVIFDGADEDTWRRAMAKLGVTGAMFSPEWAASRDDDRPLN